MQVLLSGCKKLLEFRRNLEKNENPLGEGESMTTCSLQYKMCIKYNHISCTNQRPDVLSYSCTLEVLEGAIRVNAVQLFRKVDKNFRCRISWQSVIRRKDFAHVAWHLPAVCIGSFCTCAQISTLPLKWCSVPRVFALLLCLYLPLCPVYA